MQLDIIADQFRYFQHYHIVEVHRFDTLFKFSNKNSLKIEKQREKLESRPPPSPHLLR